jgi:hypothetical protein
MIGSFALKYATAPGVCQMKERRQEVGKRGIGRWQPRRSGGKPVDIRLKSLP